MFACARKCECKQVLEGVVDRAHARELCDLRRLLIIHHH